MKTNTETFTVEILVRGEWLTLGDRLLQGEAIALHAEAERHRDAARILDSHGDVVRDAQPVYIADFDLGQLAMLLADNVQDSGPTAFDSPEQAVRMHEDDISEVAEDRHGRRLTDPEWAVVAKKALVMVSDQFATWRCAGKVA